MRLATWSSSESLASSRGKMSTSECILCSVPLQCFLFTWPLECFFALEAKELDAETWSLLCELRVELAYFPFHSCYPVICFRLRFLFPSLTGPSIHSLDPID